VTTLLDRYILKELSVPFGLSLFAVLGLLLADQLLQLMELFISGNVSLLLLSRIFLALLPALLVITLPLSVLVACITAYSRLSTDHEIVAMNAAGVGRFSLLRPALLFGGLFCAIGLTLSVWAQPWSGRSLRSAAFELLKQQAFVGLSPGTFNDLFNRMVIYVQEVTPPDELRGIFIYDNRNPKEPIITLARQGRILLDNAQNRLTFRLSEGEQHRIVQDPSEHRLLGFATYEFSLELLQIMKRSPFHPQEDLDPGEIRSQLTEEGGRDAGLLRQLEEYYKNFAFPFSCVALIPIGFILGTTVRRAGKLGGFALGVGVAFLYYMGIITGDALVSTKALLPIWGAWFPNLLFAAMGAAGLLLTARPDRWRLWRAASS
jgi:lipopolysaccharide export system permease protein